MALVGTRMRIAKREKPLAQRRHEPVGGLTCESGRRHQEVTLNAGVWGNPRGGSTGDTPLKAFQVVEILPPLIENKRGTKRELSKCKLDGQNANAPSTFFVLRFLLPAVTCGFPRLDDRWKALSSQLQLWAGVRIWHSAAVPCNHLFPSPRSWQIVCAHACNISTCFPEKVNFQLSLTCQVKCFITSLLRSTTTFNV